MLIVPELRGGSIEGEDDTLSTSEEDRKENFSNLDFKDVVSYLA